MNTDLIRLILCGREVRDRQKTFWTASPGRRPYLIGGVKAAESALDALIEETRLHDDHDVARVAASAHSMRSMQRAWFARHSQPAAFRPCLEDVKAIETAFDALLATFPANTETDLFSEAGETVAVGGKPKQHWG